MNSSRFRRGKPDNSPQAVAPVVMIMEPVHRTGRFCRFSNCPLFCAFLLTFLLAVLSGSRMATAEWICAPLGDEASRCGERCYASSSCVSRCWAKWNECKAAHPAGSPGSTIPNRNNSASPEIAAPKPTANPCNNYGQPDEVIRACTNFIQDRRLWNGQPAKALNLSGMLTMRAGAYAKLGQYDRALADHNESVKLSPKVAFPVSTRGGFYYDRGAYDEAMRDLDQTLRIDPKYTDALLNRGAIYLVRGDTARANADFAAAIRIDQSLLVNVRRKQLNIYWLRYLKEIQDERDYANWSGPPLEAYRNAPP